MQYKILHRVYLTPGRLQIILPWVTDNCARFRSPNADLVHMFWSCPDLENDWEVVGESIKEITGQQYNSTLVGVLLGLFKRQKFSRLENRFADLAWLLAK